MCVVFAVKFAVILSHSNTQRIDRVRAMLKQTTASSSVGAGRVAPCLPTSGLELSVEERRLCNQMDVCSDAWPSVGYMVLRIVRSCIAWMNCSIHLSLKFLTFRIECQLDSTMSG